MPGADPATPDSPRLPALSAYLLGTIPVDAALALQRRLAYEASGDPAAAAVVVCDHPAGVTIGRAGSRAHVRLTPDQLAARRWAVRWVPRGGGAVLHAAGQVACYPVLPLDRLGLTPAAYVAELCGVVADLAREFGASAQVDPETAAVRVRGRRVATVGVAVMNWVGLFGVIVNVDPDLEWFRAVDCDGDPAPMTSLQRECPGRVRVPAVRQRLVDLVAGRFGAGRVSVFHSHPSAPPRPHPHASPARHR